LKLQCNGDITDLFLTDDEMQNVEHA